jgi:hypothetical protein
VSPDRLNTLTHEGCFALGALCVLIPLWPALETAVAQRTRAEVRAINPGKTLDDDTVRTMIRAHQAAPIPGQTARPEE